MLMFTGSFLDALLALGPSKGCPSFGIQNDILLISKDIESICKKADIGCVASAHDGGDNIIDNSARESVTKLGTGEHEFFRPTVALDPIIMSRDLVILKELPQGVLVVQDVVCGISNSTFFAPGFDKTLTNVDKNFENFLGIRCSQATSFAFVSVFVSNPAFNDGKVSKATQSVVTFIAASSDEPKSSPCMPNASLLPDCVFFNPFAPRIINATQVAYYPQRIVNLTVLQNKFTEKITSTANMREFDDHSLQRLRFVDEPREHSQVCLNFGFISDHFLGREANVCFNIHKNLFRRSEIDCVFADYGINSLLVDARIKIVHFDNFGILKELLTKRVENGKKCTSDINQESKQRAFGKPNCVVGNQSRDPGDWHLKTHMQIGNAEHCLKRVFTVVGINIGHDARTPFSGLRIRQRLNIVLNNVPMNTQVIGGVLLGFPQNIFSHFVIAFFFCGITFLNLTCNRVTIYRKGVLNFLGILTESTFLRKSFFRKTGLMSLCFCQEVLRSITSHFEACNLLRLFASRLNVPRREQKIEVVQL